MKLLFLLSLFGLSAATIFEGAWENVRDKTAAELMHEVRAARGTQDATRLDEAENEIKTLEEAFDEVQENIKDPVGKGKKFRRDLIEKINKFLSKEGKDVRSLKESWEELKQRIKDYFKDKHIHLKEKFVAFFEWLKESIHNGFEVTKDKTQAIKNIARELMKYSKEVKKEVIIEALELLKPYEEVLGDIWKEFEQTMKVALHRED